MVSYFILDQFYSLCYGMLVSIILFFIVNFDFLAFCHWNRPHFTFSLNFMSFLSSMLPIYSFLWEKQSKTCNFIVIKHFANVKIYMLVVPLCYHLRLMHRLIHLVLCQWLPGMTWSLKDYHHFSFSVFSCCYRTWNVFNQLMATICRLNAEFKRRLSLYVNVFSRAARNTR